jgi:hypothetical protein
MASQGFVDLPLRCKGCNAKKVIEWSAQAIPEKGQAMKFTSPDSCIRCGCELFTLDPAAPPRP